MAVHSRTPASSSMSAGSVWLLAIDVVDADGVPVDDAPVVTVILPDASTVTPTVETLVPGRYRVEYIPAVGGRFLAEAVTASHGSAAFVTYVAAVVGNAAMPDVAAVDDYLGPDEHSWADDVLQDALDAEGAAQRAVCRVPAAYPADLREALLRRVARNLAMRRQLLAGPQGDADAGPAILPGRDPEVRRLEAPWRKLAVG